MFITGSVYTFVKPTSVKDSKGVGSLELQVLLKDIIENYQDHTYMVIFHQQTQMRRLNALREAHGKTINIIVA